MGEKRKSPSAGEQEGQNKNQTKTKNKLTGFLTLFKRIVFFFLCGFDRLLTRFINDILIRFSFLVTAQCQRLESKLDEKEVRHD